jgi:hypothetical protein
LRVRTFEVWNSLKVFVDEEFVRDAVKRHLEISNNLISEEQMFTKKLFKLGALLVVLTIVLSISVLAQIYVSATDGDDTFGTGVAMGTQAYSSISKAISMAATGTTIYVEAGTYDAAHVRPVQAGGTGDDILAVTGTKSLTFVAVARGVDVTVIVTYGININTSGTVSLGQTGETFNLGVTATALKLTQGTLNIGSAKVVLGNGATLTVTDGTLNAIPITTTNLFVVFNGVNAVASTSAFLPSSLGTGTLIINKATGALTIDNTALSASAITITNTVAVTIGSNVTTTGTISVSGGTAAVIFNGSVTSGGNITNAANAAVTLNGNVTLGSATAGSAVDIINSSTGTTTIGASAANTLTLYSTVDAATVGTDANVGEIKNTLAGGKIVVNSTLTENIKNTGVKPNGGDQTGLTIGLPLIYNSGGSGAAITLAGNVTFVNTNVVGTAATDNQVSHIVIIENAGAGTITIGGTIATPASTAAFTTPDNAHISVALLNLSGGTLTTRAAALRGAITTTGLQNAAAGTMTLGQVGDAFTAGWTIANAGTTLTLNGTGALGGALTNNATCLVVLGANQTIAGTVVNNGKIKLNANTLTLSLTGADALTGSGDIYSVTTATTTVPGGTIIFTGKVGSSSYAGNLANVEIASTGSGSSFSLTGPNTLWGNLVTSGAGPVTIATPTTVKGNFNLTGAATVTINGATAVVGDINMTAGNITMAGAGLTVSGTFNIPQGTFTFGANTLTVNGDFNRTGGTVVPNNGKMLISGPKPQSIIPGTQMHVYSVEVANAGTYIAGYVENQDLVTLTGSLFVDQDFKITSGLLIMGTDNIRMEQLTASARFTNGGRGYTATGIGGLIFEGSGANLAGAGDGAVITGSKTYSNLYVRLTTQANNVYCLGTITISGTVTLDGGGIIWGAPDDGTDLFSSSTLTLDKSLTDPLYPTVVINTANTHASPFLTGTPAMTITPLYNLTYTGSVNKTMSATDFTTGYVNNLSLIAGTGKTITGLGTPMAIAGNLSVNALETLDLGTSTLTLSSNTGAHAVSGTVTNGTLAITGNGAALTGGTGASSIVTLTVTNASGTFTSTGMKVFGTVTINGAALVDSIGMNSATATITNFVNTAGTTMLNMNSTVSAINGNVTVTAGSLNLTMKGAAAATATIAGLLNVNGGTFTLGSNIWVTGAVVHNGTSVIALGANNLTLADAYTHDNTATFTAGAGAVVATNSVSKVYTLTTAVTIPNLTVTATGIQLAGAAGGLTVSNVFVHTAGAVDLNSLPLTISGRTYTYTAGTYANTGAAATGVINLTGDTATVTMAAGPTYQYLTINSTGIVTFASSSSTARTIVISQLLTQTKGTLAIGINDISFATGGTGYTFTKGAITATTSATVPGTIGEFIFNGATGFTPGASKSLTIPNLTINAATAVAGTDTFYVANRLTFGAGSLTLGATVDRMIVKDGATVVRVNTGTLSQAPKYAGVIDLVYMTTAGITTGVELPTNATTTRNLTINSAITLAASDTVNSTLTLGAALTTATGKTISLAVGGKVVVNAGGSMGTVALAPAGAYSLTYNSTGSTAKTEWPVSANVTDLTVASSGTLTLDATRKVGNFTLTSGTFLLSADTLSVTGTTTLTAGMVDATGGGTLVVQGNVNAAGATFGTTVQMAFTGAANQYVGTPTGGATIGNITINKTYGSNIVKITGGDLTCNQIVTFNNGLLMTDTTNALVLTNSGGGSTNKGFVRNIVTGGKSHVVGNVRQDLQYSTLIAYAQNTFPVGDTANYRPATLTFVISSAFPTGGNYGVIATVSHTNSRPTGTAGLPITNGIVDGVDLARYPSFFWSIKTSSGMGATAFNLDLTAAGFNPTEIDLNELGLNHVKIIRRNGTPYDVQNQWNLQGLRDSYNNIISAGVPDVTAINATSGLEPTGAIFTYGVKSNLTVLNAITDKTLNDNPIANRTIKIKLTNPAVFTGNTGTLVYTVSSSNPVIATATLLGTDTLQVKGLRAGGPVVITITGKDVDNSQISTTFNVTVTGNTGVEVSPVIPTEFSLSQNYPNPFNPSTTINFGLPVASNVTLKIYNILGEQVADVVNQVMPAGYHQVVFDGSKLASGLYIYRIEAGNFVQVKKMMMLK